MNSLMALWTAHGARGSCIPSALVDAEVSNVLGLNPIHVRQMEATSFLLEENYSHLWTDIPILLHRGRM